MNSNSLTTLMWWMWGTWKTIYTMSKRDFTLLYMWFLSIHNIHCKLRSWCIYLVQKSWRWVKNYSFYSQNCYIKTQTDEMSCLVLFIIWVARNSLKPVAEIKGEFVVLDGQILLQNWKDILQQGFLRYDKREGKCRR